MAPEPKKESATSSAKETLDQDFLELVEYDPPPWCKCIDPLPRYRIPLAMKPTPIHKWRVRGIPEGFELSVKREDLTGCELTGNKVRKLEFILADAKKKGCTDVITAGSTQSNHARATLIAASQVGLDCHLVLRDKDESCKLSPPSGNFLLMETGEPNIYLLPWNEFSIEKVNEAEMAIEKLINEQPGRSAYCIPLGGDTPFGLHGYIYVWDEMMKQGIQERFDDVVCAAGTCGTAVGLAIGNYLTGSRLRVHVISICYDEELVYNQIDEKLSMFGLDVSSRVIADVIDDHIGGGYSEFSKEDMEFCTRVARTTGIYCDPVYVGKALKGLTEELETHPDRFQGRRILFIHTGGLFGMMDEAARVLMNSKTATDKIVNWVDAFPENKTDVSKK